MPIKTVDIRELKPTDLLRKNSFRFMVKLVPDEVKSLGPPSVLYTERGLLITDGNHRVATLFGKGEERVEVDYADARELNPAYSFNTVKILDRQQQMQRKGIVSPEGLLIECLERAR